MSDRELVLDIVRAMPTDSSVSEIAEEIALLASVKTGLAQADNGQGTPHEDVAKLLQQWITRSSGRRAA